MSDQNENRSKPGRKTFLGFFEIVPEGSMASSTVAAEVPDADDGTIKVGSSVWQRIENPQTDDQELEAEALALVQTFDSRIAENEKRIDRVLARLGIE